ncbi:MAG TPA: YciI family protein [Solirubrobacteraceae bacterium]|nr:YciI family protein [Solirubrobacteraceae bacterium]
MPRFMLLMIPTGLSDEDWGEGPSADDVGEMMKFNEALTQAGVLLALDGLHPSSKGARITSAGGKKTVTDGPFTEAKELVGGYWVIDVKSKDEAVEWATRCPLGDGDILEVRQVAELSEFPEDVQAVAQLSQEPPEQTSARR